MAISVLKLNDLVDEIRAILASRTGRETRLLFLGEMLNAGLGFLLNVLVIRKLAVQDYGLFTLFSSTMLLLAGFGSFGWTESFVRFGSKYKDEPLFERLNRLFFLRAMGCAALVALALLLASPALAESLYHRPNITNFLRMAAIGGFGLCVNGYCSAYLRARLEFKSYFQFQVAQTCLRVAGVAALFFLHVLSVENIVLVYALAPGITAIPVTALLGKRMRAPGTELTAQLRGEINSYNGWLLLAIFTTTLIGNIDSHFLAHFSPDNKQMADFGVATRLTLPIGFLITALNATVLPKLSAAKGPESVLIYFDKLKKFLFPIAAIVLVAGLAAIPLLERMAGSGYSDIDSLLRLQIVALVLILLVNPLGIVLYAHGKTHLLAMMNFGQLVLDLVLDAWLIPGRGAAGAILATIGVNVMGLVLVYYWTYQIIRQARDA